MACAGPVAEYAFVPLPIQGTCRHAAGNQVGCKGQGSNGVKYTNMPEQALHKSRNPYHLSPNHGHRSTVLMWKNPASCLPSPHLEGGKTGADKVHLIVQGLAGNSGPLMEGHGGKRCPIPGSRFHQEHVHEQEETIFRVTLLGPRPPETPWASCTAHTAEHDMTRGSYMLPYPHVDSHLADQETFLRVTCFTKTETTQ